MLTAIKASKLYRASTRKSAILAAINNPINSDLVKQLKSQLDEEYQTVDNLVPENEQLEEYQKDNASDIAKQDDEGASATPSGHAPSSHGGSSHGIAPTMSPDMGTDSEPIGEEEGSEGEVGKDVGEPDQGESLDESPEGPVEALADDSDVESSKEIKAQTVLYHEAEVADDLPSILNRLLGTLNVDAATSGVARIQVQEKELWIYYNDSINLNDIMEAVIAKLHNANYREFDFNRLARSKNAIVFDILNQEMIEPSEDDAK